MPVACAGSATWVPLAICILLTGLTLLELYLYLDLGLLG
jgi:hypothetical protein